MSAELVSFPCDSQSGATFPQESETFVWKERIGLARLKRNRKSVPIRNPREARLPRRHRRFQDPSPLEPPTPSSSLGAEDGRALDNDRDRKP